MADLPTYRYLNLELGWPLFRRTGLAVGEAGELRLAEVPRLDAEATDPLAPVPGFEGPAGVGVDHCGNIYIADPAHHRILRIDVCDGSVEPLRCLTGPGAGPGQLDTPRGILAGPRGTLYVADSGNRRVQLIDLATGGLRGIWSYGFAEPWDLAADRADAVYVADPGTKQVDGTWSGGRVWKLAASGAVDPSWSLGAPAPGAPTSVAVTLLDPGDPESERLLMLDRQPPRILVYRLDGAYDDAATGRWAAVAGIASAPSSIGITPGGALYVADPGSNRVLVFAADGSFLGTALGADAGVAGVALDCRGRLIAHPGSGSAVRRALGLPSFVQCGSFLAGPFSADTEPTRWQRLQLEVDALPDGAHFRLFTLTSGSASPPPDPAPCGDAPGSGFIEPDALEATPVGQWRAHPWDATDTLALNEPATYLWIAGVLQGDGTTTPTLRQLRLLHDEDGWLHHLPAIYTRNETSRVFLERALALFETPYEDERALIEGLPRLFDPLAAPDGDASWLEWLADWVGAELHESWDDATRRGTVASAFEVFGRRGTRATLQQLVRLYAGATVHLTEPAVEAGLWALGSAASLLGVDTALAGTLPQGAVLGSTAVVDHSTLESEDPRGRPAFEDWAHRFTAEVYAAELSGPDALEQVRRVLDREKPAHTTYDLCVIEARMRVGAQARVGIDTIVGGPPTGGAFTGTRRLGEESVLPDSGRRHGTAVGERARLGMATTLG